jgi:hypothetical protein
MSQPEATICDMHNYAYKTKGGFCPQCRDSAPAPAAPLGAVEVLREKIGKVIHESQYFEGGLNDSKAIADQVCAVLSTILVPPTPQGHLADCDVILGVGPCDCGAAALLALPAPPAPQPIEKIEQLAPQAAPATRPDEAGIQRKYEILRRDGSSAPGGKHEKCAYFVLDLTHDEFSRPALTAYMDACEKTHPGLARDLKLIINAAPCGCRGVDCGHISPRTMSGAMGYLLTLDDAEHRRGFFREDSPPPVSAPAREPAALAPSRLPPTSDEADRVVDGLLADQHRKETFAPIPPAALDIREAQDAMICEMLRRVRAHGVTGCGFHAVHALELGELDRIIEILGARKHSDPLDGSVETPSPTAPRSEIREVIQLAQEILSHAPSCELYFAGLGFDHSKPSAYQARSRSTAKANGPSKRQRWKRRFGWRTHGYLRRASASR